MKLHFREMIEPTGAREHAIESEIKPWHQALVQMPARRLGLRRADALAGFIRRHLQPVLPVALTESQS
jgi:hypothetical protein